MDNLEWLKTSSRVNGMEGQQCVLLYIKASMLISWLVMWGWAAPGSVGIWTTLLCCAGQVRHAARTRLSARLHWKCTARALVLTVGSSDHINLWMLLWKNTKYNKFKSNLKPIKAWECRVGGNVVNIGIGNTENESRFQKKKFLLNRSWICV